MTTARSVPSTLAAAERADLADLLATLTPGQWDAPSLCAGWRVRDVVAHLIAYDGLPWRELLGHAVRARFSLDRINDALVAEWATRDTAELVAEIRAHPYPSGLVAMFGGRVGLLDVLLHQQDIRRPLGLPRVVPPDRLAVVLEFAAGAPPIRWRRRCRGLRMLATDLDFRYGDGLDVAGPAEALLVAGAGRADALDELAGTGVGVLAERIAAEQAAQPAA
ncbi:maleylpyruvate isomerase family mycothiol-dependent enzyme [Pseudonocardia phyllosphaerae]|uniref:maleylpyruvate isomerase family mycothiol-dependent enzyme n=1 Tax=Pseudonocardia phyllosphaerae TaxID=3390502 RepID=UPI003978BD60